MTNNLWLAVSIKSGKGELFIQKSWDNALRHGKKDWKFIIFPLKIWNIFYFYCVCPHVFFVTLPIHLNINLVLLNVEKAKAEIGFAFLRSLSLSLLNASFPGSLFCTTQKVLTSVKNLHLPLYVCICLKNKGKNWWYSSC